MEEKDCFSKMESDEKELTMACAQLSQNFQLLFDGHSSLQVENDRMKSVVAEVLESANKPSARQEKEKVEFMKPYTHELLTKNEIAAERIRILEKELASEKARTAETGKKQQKCINKVQQLAESVTITQEQLRSCQEHLLQLSQQVKGLQVKNAELDLVNTHQKCILLDYHNSINILRKELLQSHASGEDNCLRRQELYGH